MIRRNISDAFSSQGVEFLHTVPVVSLELGRFPPKKIMAILTDTVSTCSENFVAPSQGIEV